MTPPKEPRPQCMYMRIFDFDKIETISMACGNISIKIKFNRMEMYE